MTIPVNILDGTKVGLQLFIWKIIQSLIHNNTRINCVSYTHNCKPAFPLPMYGDLSQNKGFST